MAVEIALWLFLRKRSFSFRNMYYGWHNTMLKIVFKINNTVREDHSETGSTSCGWIMAAWGLCSHNTKFSSKELKSNWKPINLSPLQTPLQLKNMISKQCGHLSIFNLTSKRPFQAQKTLRSFPGPEWQVRVGTGAGGSLPLPGWQGGCLSECTWLLVPTGFCPPCAGREPAVSLGSWVLLERNVKAFLPEPIPSSPPRNDLGTNLVFPPSILLSKCHLSMHALRKSYTE